MHTCLTKPGAEQFFSVALGAEQHIMASVNELLPDGKRSSRMTASHANQSIANAHVPTQPSLSLRGYYCSAGDVKQTAVEDHSASSVAMYNGG
jgi:hypothetical protein